MDLFPAPLDLTELADRAGVSIRTVRYYIQQGLLPSPEARGPGAHYSEEHLERLLLVKRLQREHLPLAEIRRVLDAKGNPGPDASNPAPDPLGARQYIREALKKNEYLGVRESTPSLSSAPASPEPGPPRMRSQWERITLAPDIELHIRRPLSRVVNKQVERLIDAARDIFSENS